MKTNVIIIFLSIFPLLLYSQNGNNIVFENDSSNYTEGEFIDRNKNGVWKGYFHDSLDMIYEYKNGICILGMRKATQSDKFLITEKLNETFDTLYTWNYDIENRITQYNIYYIESNSIPKNISLRAEHCDFMPMLMNCTTYNYYICLSNNDILQVDESINNKLNSRRYYKIDLSGSKVLLFELNSKLILINGNVKEYKKYNKRELKALHKMFRR